MRNPELEAVTSELQNCGVRHSVEDEGKHIKVKWWHQGKPRVCVVAKTGSDVRGPLNARALARRMLREDGHDVDSGPKPAPRTTSLAAALELPKAPLPQDMPAERLARVESELKILTDLILGITPAFDAVLDESRSLADLRPREVRISLTTNPRRSGLALAALFSMGFTPQEVNVEPLGATAKSEVHVPVMATRGAAYATNEQIVGSLRANPQTLQELEKALNIPLEKKVSFTQRLQYLKNKGLLKAPERRGGQWSAVITNGAGIQ